MNARLRVGPRRVAGRRAGRFDPPPRRTRPRRARRNRPPARAESFRRRDGWPPRRAARTAAAPAGSRAAAARINRDRVPQRSHQPGAAVGLIRASRVIVIRPAGGARRRRRRAASGATRRRAARIHRGFPAGSGAEDRDSGSAAFDQSAPVGGGNVFSHRAWAGFAPSIARLVNGGRHVPTQQAAHAVQLVAERVVGRCRLAERQRIQPQRPAGRLRTRPPQQQPDHRPAARPRSAPPPARRDHLGRA